MKETFKLPELPYEYKDLEPYIDATTMETHHSKHHAGYVKKLNAAIEEYEELHDKTIEEILTDTSIVPDAVEQAVINNGGGHANHSLFWKIMEPEGNGSPIGELADEIEQEFGSFENFKTLFKEAALTQFGSGWAWLVVDENGKLSIVATANQDSPLSNSLKPIINLDVWEHAYYLKYKNLRGDYIDAWWNVVNWEKANENYVEAIE